MPSFKTVQTAELLDFLEAHNTASVDEILLNTDIDKLRIYAIIMELKLAGKIDIIGRSSWGTPQLIRLLPPHSPL